MGSAARGLGKNDFVRSQYVDDKRSNCDERGGRSDVPPVRGNSAKDATALQRRIVAAEPLTFEHRKQHAAKHRFESRRALKQAATFRRRARQARRLPFAAHVGAMCRYLEQKEKRRADWHAGRASGQLARHQDSAHCGKGQMVISCACGSSKAMPVRCGVTRLCVACREHRAQKRRAQLWAARRLIVNRLKSAGLWGLFGEKHLILTLPDPRIPCTKKRIAVLFDAWRRFSRRLQKHVKGWEEFAYSRTFEWTPGRDGKGHPHFHVWMISRYLDRDMLWHWWARSLASAGLCLTPCDRQAVYIKEVRLEYIIREVVKGGKQIKLVSLKARDVGGKHDVIGYVESWSIAEHDENSRATPETMARVYEALEGKRQNQTSRGLMSMAPSQYVCEHCGSTECTVEIERWFERLQVQSSDVAQS